MGAYIPMLVWLLSMVVCFYIAKKRNVTPTLILELAVVFLGPFAIPIILLVKPAKDAA
jgi:hypothetical protein